VVYNANTLAEMVVAKKSLQNWLTYYTNKLERKSKRKTVKEHGVVQDKTGKPAATLMGKWDQSMVKTK
ncbi:hypothetical protein Tco_1350157, partial [Tanacetum coccineum]